MSAWPEDGGEAECFEEGEVQLWLRREEWGGGCVGV